MNKQSIIKQRITFCLLAVLTIVIEKTAGLGQQQIPSKQRLVGYPELVSPNVWIPKKDFDAAKQLLKSEIEARKIKVHKQLEELCEARGLSLPPAQTDIAIDVKGKQDDSRPDIVVISNAQAMILAKALEDLADQNIAKSNYLQAKTLLQAAITITKDTGRNAVALERYQKDYANLSSKIDQQNVMLSQPKDLKR